MNTAFSAQLTKSRMGATEAMLRHALVLAGRCASGAATEESIST